MSKKINSLGIQDKYTKLYRKAVSNECRGNTNFNEGEIKEFLYSKGILKIGEDKNNARILKALRHMFKDEMNSYAIQSETNKIIGRPLSTKICGNRSQNFKNMVSDLGQESKHISLNRIRKFFGLKPNIAKEQEIALANSSPKKAVNFSISKENVIKDKSSKIFKSETKATDT